MKFPFASLALALLASARMTDAQPPAVLQIHGSGTTNPSKCYWHIMDQLEEQIKLPAKLSYRAVGSSTGQAEFIGDASAGPDNDFGSGDIPIGSASFNELAAAGVEIVHLPVVLGAISFFHSVPVPNLNLSPCLLAKILDRRVLNWNDAEVIAENADIASQLPDGSLPINVARRALGSSSTASITAFLHEACSTEWPADKVGKAAEDVGWAADTQICEGSSGMSACIRETPGTIGYIDAGHGHAEGLREIELENASGTFLTSKLANENGGILQAALAPDANLPSDLDADFGDVQLLNKPGEFTWPIVALSYVYVRKDLPSFIPDPYNQQLLKAFLHALYRDEYIDDCDELFSFTPVTGELRDKARAAIDGLTTNATDDQMFMFEVDTMKRTGQGDLVISQKRDTYAAVEQRQIVKNLAALEDVVASGSTGTGGSTTSDNSDLASTVSSLQQTISALTARVNALESESASLKAAVEDLGGDVTTTASTTKGESHTHDFTDDDETKLEAALALAIVAFVFWCVAIIVGLAKMCGLF